MNKKAFIAIVLSFLGGASIDAVCGMESNKLVGSTSGVDKTVALHEEVLDDEGSNRNIITKFLLKNSFGENVEKIEIPDSFRTCVERNNLLDEQMKGVYDRTFEIVKKYKKNFSPIGKVIDHIYKETNNKFVGFECDGKRIRNVLKKLILEGDELGEQCWWLEEFGGKDGFCFAEWRSADYVWLLHIYANCFNRERIGRNAVDIRDGLYSSFKTHEDKFVRVISRAFYKGGFLKLDFDKIKATLVDKDVIQVSECLDEILAKIGCSYVLDDNFEEKNYEAFGGKIKKSFIKSTKIADDKNTIYDFFERAYCENNCENEKKIVDFIFNHLDGIGDEVFFEMWPDKRKHYDESRRSVQLVFNRLKNIAVAESVQYNLEKITEKLKNQAIEWIFVMRCATIIYDNVSPLMYVAYLWATDIVTDLENRSIADRYMDEYPCDDLKIDYEKVKKCVDTYDGCDDDLVNKLYEKGYLIKNTKTDSENR